MRVLPVFVFSIVARDARLSLDVQDNVVSYVEFGCFEG